MTATELMYSAGAAMVDALAAALGEETRLVRAMTATFRAQRDAIGRDDAEGVGDATFAANRIVHTMNEARRRRRALLGRVTGTEDVELFALEDVLGARMNDTLRAARNELAGCARELSEEVVLNRMILRVALAAGEEQMRMLRGVQPQTAGYGATGRPIGAPGGQLGEALAVLNRSIPALREGLDTLSRGIVAAVNTAHRQGSSARGQSGVDFLDEAGGTENVTARSMRLSAAVLADGRAIAAGSADAEGNYRSGANDIALRLAALNETADAALGEVSVNEYYGAWVTGLALATSSARQTASAHDVLLQQASLRRERVSGVSTDDEMIKLVQHQAAYSAAARLVTAADELLQTILQMV